MQTGFTQKEKEYIKQAEEISRVKGRADKMSELCDRAYKDYRAGSISGEAYHKIHLVSMNYAFPR